MAFKLEHLWQTIVLLTLLVLSVPLRAEQQAPPCNPDPATGYCMPGNGGNSAAGGNGTGVAAPVAPDYSATYNEQVALWKSCAIECGGGITIQTGFLNPQGKPWIPFIQNAGANPNPGPRPSADPRVYAACVQSCVYGGGQGVPNGQPTQPPPTPAPAPAPVPPGISPGT